jgi:hypothetical protein
VKFSVCVLFDMVPIEWSVVTISPGTCPHSSQKKKKIHAI